MNKLNITEKKLKGRTRIIVETAFETKKRLERRERLEGYAGVFFMVIMYLIVEACLIYYII